MTNEFLGNRGGLDGAFVSVDERWSRQAVGQHLGTLMVHTTGAQVRGGVIPANGTPLGYLPTSGLSATLKAGTYAWSVTDAALGPMKIVHPADEVFTHDTAHASQPRTDLIIAELVDNGDTTSTPKIRILKGTAGVGAPDPTLPSSLGNGAVVALHRVLIPAAATTLSTITDLRTFTAAAGGVVVVATLAATSTLPTGTPFFTLDVERFGVKTAASYQLFRADVAGTGVLAGTIPASAMPYSYRDARTIAANGTGKTAITWPAFNAVQSVQVAVQYGGSIGTNPVVVLYSEVTTSGCNLEFVDKDGGIVTSGSYVVSLLVSGA